jgi:hypothetical protein
LEPNAAKKMTEFPQIDPEEDGWIPVKKAVLKNKIGLIFPKKDLQKEQGFVSLVPTSNDTYFVQVNGSGTVEVSAWVNGIESPGYVAEIEKRKGKNLLGRDIFIQLKNAPQNIELRITYNGKTASCFPFN